MWDSDGDGRAGCSSSIRTASSSVSNVEFGKVERKLSKKLNSTVVVYKSKSKPGYVYRLTVKMETSMCVADAANWGNIELAARIPHNVPNPYRLSKLLVILTLASSVVSFVRVADIAPSDIAARATSNVCTSPAVIRAH